MRTDDSAREAWQEALELFRAQRRTREADRMRSRLSRVRTGRRGLGTVAASNNRIP